MQAVHPREPGYPGDLFEHLRAFLLLARRIEAGPRRAFEESAAALHLDVSVLRRRMATLSAWLGVPLFEGRGPGLKLGRGGARAREIAQRALGEIASLRADLRGEPPSLSIGCTGTITTELLPDVVRDLVLRFPGLEVHLRRVGATLGEALLRRGELDFAVVRSERAPVGFPPSRIAQDRLWLVVPRGHALASARSPTLREMARHPLILYGEGSTTRARILERLSPLGASVRVEVSSRSAALRYVELGLGVAFLSLLPGHRVDEPGVVVHDVTPLFRKTSFWLLARRPEPASAVERYFLRRVAARARARARKG